MTTIAQSPLPITVHSTTPLSPSAASSHLSQFLQRASIDPSYRPDSTLSNRGDGPQSNSGGTGNINLTLFQLERILKGINGENLGGLEKATQILNANTNSEDATPDPGWGQRERKGGYGTGNKVKRVTTVPVIATGDQGDGTQASEWQDKDAFEREQVIVQGEIGDRDGTVPDALVSEDILDAGDAMELDGENEGMRTANDHGGPSRPKTAEDKEERKRKKKERLKEEKRAKEAARKKS